MENGVYGGYDLDGGIDQLDFHSHSQLEIYQLVAGNVYYQVGDHFYDLQAGDILLIDGMRLHKAFVSPDSKQYRRSMIHFDSGFIAPVLASLGAEDLLGLFTNSTGYLYRISDQAAAGRIGQTISELVQLVDRKDSNQHRQLIQVKLVSLLLEIDLAADESLIGRETSDDRIRKVEDVTRFITRHYQESLTLDDIARGVNISRSYLPHLFKEVTGTTVMSFLMSYRLTQARFQLFMNRELPIQDIAKQCGFESPAHFSRFFKQKMQMTPKQFRNLSYAEAFDTYSDGKVKA
ncbi:hypothetical protein AWM75_03260 [Aerococcus urinaehominis]|uniref:Uncharacterized protein n=1 Tax=Aerococcus urinaehominis TaxID=128944 RepID=A0A0X8FKN4_9LACT|nr:AraC family transcriptional regulator [Aerococcus urinaehominis]AMB99078.1 hypothetical protein AWM75_03260 [Aerococcus urinaehominis]SDM02811.1 AraC-type DNA-binding protein [Aerococcus urinaehominis]